MNAAVDILIATKIFDAPHMGLILKIVSEFYHIDNIEVIIGTFYPAYILLFMDYYNGLFFRIWVMENEFVQSLFY